MVARILTGESIRGLINYNESKVAIGTAVPFMASRFGLDIDQLEIRHKVARFKHLTKLNSRVKTNAVHIMLNFHQSEILSENKLQQIAMDYMEKIGFADQPFLAYRHHDASHPHIHIVTTNIKANSTRIDMHNIGRTLSEKARREIEVEYQLVRAEGRAMEQQIIPAGIDIAIYGEKQTKRTIYNIVKAVIRSYRFSSLAEYNAVLNTFNVIADRGPEGSMMFERRGLVYSMLGEDGGRVGIPFKASSFAGKPTLNKVESKFSTNHQKKKGYTETSKHAISKVLEKHHLSSREELVAELEKVGISLVFRQNNDGRIYGLTYVDHNTHCVFNGSELGKSFSAKAVLDSIDNSRMVSVENGYFSPPLPKRSNMNNIRLPENISAKSTGESLLQFLFEKPAYEPPIALTGKRKKKKKGHLRNNNLSNGI